MKVHQYSGPVMAKGLEDTAFYRYNRFIALNEVGGDPDRFGVSISTFHKANQNRVKRWPHSMLNTSTHDSKRGEDTRARLAVLSEIQEEWAAQVQSWSKVIRARRGDIEATAPPNRNDEYMFYQMLLGSWPPELATPGEADGAAEMQSYIERLKSAMTKSMREAKVHSSWSAPNRAYENAVISFIDTALKMSGSAFFSLFMPFQERIARLGVQNGLVQTALKLTAPGVPDIYQGAELWNLSLVDPDHRYPVDYERRVALLDRMDTSEERCERPQKLLHCWRDGAIKLLVTRELLAIRKADPDLLAQGSYELLLANGPKAECVCGFARRWRERTLIVATALFPARREADSLWGETDIPLPSNIVQSEMREVLTRAPVLLDGSRLRAEAAFQQLPVAVFVT
jgi:(1->4)-alpha-D-glucan 1-alpha-D-glucosylmutase